MEGNGGTEEEALIFTTTGSAAVNGVATFHFSVEVLSPFECPLVITAINRRNGRTESA